MEKRIQSVARHIERNFLGEQREIDWFINGMGNFSRSKATVSEHLKRGGEKNPLFSYLSGYSTQSGCTVEAARAWSVYEQSCSTLRPLIARRLISPI